MAVGAERGAGSTGRPEPASPRFDLRFAAGRGLLRLARPLPAGLARIEELELSLGTVRFPLDVTEGPSRFRTRRTVVRSALVCVDPRDLVRTAATAGVDLIVSGPASGGAFAAAVRDAVGTIAFDAFVVAEGVDLLVALDRVRIVGDGPATPWARLEIAARKLGLVLDEERGAWRFERPVRGLLAEALVTRGWRLPDERTAELSPPRHRDGLLWLGMGPHAQRRADDGPAPALLEEARLLAPVVACLAEDDLAGAADRLEVTAHRLEERPRAEAELHLALRRLRTALGCEAGRDDTQVDPDAGDPHDLAVGLRLALRRGDAAAAATFAERLDGVEPVAELAAEGLLLASEAVRQHDAAHARRLVGRALLRRPGDVGLLVRCIELAELAGDAEGVSDIARRALSSPLAGDDRARTAAAAARALERMSEPPDTEPLWREALYASPEDPEALAGLGALHARRGDRETAVARFDRASRRFGEGGDRASAARALQRSAELLAGAGRPGAAEQRLEEAVSLADADPALWCALARVRVRLGAVDAAATAYASLLALGARAPATLAPALVEAACFHLDERADPEAAEPFVAMLARRNSKDPRVAALRDRARSRAPEADDGRGAAGASSLDDVLDALAACPAEDAHRLADLVRRALEAARGASEPGAVGDLAERLASGGKLPNDPELLDTLERHAIEPASRAVLARALSRTHREAGRSRQAALALARAGAALRDAATLRAAMDLAEEAGAWAEAFEAVSIALDVVGEGPARAQLLTRRERIEERRG